MSCETKTNGTFSKLWASAFTRGSRPHARPEQGGARVQDMGPNLGRVVGAGCAAERLPPRSRLGADLGVVSKEPAGRRGQGGPFPGGRTVWPPPSPILSGSVPVLCMVLVAIFRPARALRPLEGHEGGN